MMSIDTNPKVINRRRLITVITATVLCAALWALGVLVLGHALTVPGGNGRPSFDIGLPMVLLFSMGAGFLGWGLAALLEKATPKGTKIWVAIAVVVLIASFGPLVLSEMATGTRIVLGLLHLVVGVVLIPGIKHTSPHQQGEVTGEQEQHDTSTSGVTSGVHR